ncbi:hypothetical protein [Mammaliicoccus vitulinus]|uniref:hypothetical protein n=1 Tax=Mammaliicoccus vitulinus TaxID=71237 RepID=UPI003BA2DCA7
MMNHVLTKFHKAYMVYPNQFSVNDEYYQKNIEFHDYKVYFSDDLDDYQDSMSGTKVVLLGHLVHTKNSELNYHEIFSQLLSHEIDSYEFLEEMSFYNGRYALFLECNEQLYFYNDATSFLSLYYHADLPVYASHSELLKQLIEQLYNIGCEQIANKSNGFLDYSKYKDIYKFNANTRLNMTQQKIERIYPIKSYEEKSAEDVISLINDEIKESVKYLFGLDKKVLCSVTAGHDSKVSLSYIKDHTDSVNFFTYTKNIEALENNQVAQIYRIDELIAQKLAYNLNLNHTLFNMDNLPINPKLNEDYDLYETSHSIKLINYYSENNDFKNVIHLKSTIFELAKGIIPKSIQRRDSFFPYKNTIKKWAKDFPIDDELVTKYLSDFIDRNDLNKTIQSGYHPFEILYYESRMNGWHSGIIQESDNYLDVFSLINTRHILFELLNINDSDKRNQQLHKLIVKNNWPILNYFQVNNSDTLEDKVIHLKEQLDERISNLENIVIESKDFYQYIKLNKTRFRALSNEFSKVDKKQLVLTNNTNNIRKIEIKTFYDKSDGRGIIYFDLENDTIDLVDLSLNGYDLTFSPQETKIISVYASKNFEKSSWINASEFEIIEK